MNGLRRVFGWGASLILALTLGAASSEAQLPDQSDGALSKWDHWAALPREDETMSSMGIVGFDPETGEVGIAMASHYFAVGPVATHARGGVGAIATMGGAPYQDGALMLDWLEEGATPEQVLDRVRGRYENAGQIIIVDAQGRSAGYTSGTQRDWKGQRLGTHYAAAGNVLAGPAVVDGFADTFESTTASGLPLAERLMMALEAADAAGGDSRGRLAGALKVYKPGTGYRGSDLYLDVRIDDSPHAIEELRDLYERWKVERMQEYGKRMIVQTTGADVARLQEWLAELGYADRTNREIFDDAGLPRGRFNDATVAAVLSFKEAHDLGSSPTADRPVVLKMIQMLKGRSQWSNPLRPQGGGN